MAENSSLSHETLATANQASSGETCNGDQASNSRDPHSRLRDISSSILIAALISSGTMFYSATPSAADDSASTFAPTTPPAATTATDMGMDWNGSGAGGSMQWVPDPTISPSKDPDIDTAADNEKSAVESNDEKPKDETVATAEPLIDEYGSELPPATTKPFDYKGAADDLFASPSPSPTTQTKTEGGNAFDDSRFSMDKDDKEVVENLSFKLYDGRSKQ